MIDDDHTPTVYNAEDVLKKEAKGIDDNADLGEVQEVSPEYIRIKIVCDILNS